MSGFKTLVWREFRSSWSWAVGLIASLAVWAWLAYMLSGALGPPAAVAVSLLFLSIAFVLGMIVLAFMVGRLYGEIKREENRFLFLSPLSGYTHVIARLTFAVGVGWIYALGLGLLGWLTLVRAGAQLGIGDIVQLVLVSPTFITVTLMMPTLAWVLLLVMFMSSYRLSRLGWLAVIAMGAGTPVSLIYAGVNTLDHHLPVWHLAPGIVRFLGHVANNPVPARGNSWTILVPNIIHSGDLLGALLFAGLLVFLAGRLWEEVEG